MGPLSFEQRVRRGDCYTATTPVLSAGLLTNLKATIQNPSNSGKQIYIYCIESVVGAGTMFWASVFKNPDSSPPTTVLASANQNIASNNTTVAIIKADISSTGLAKGTGSDMFTFGIPGSARVAYKEQLLVLPQGTTVGINVPILLSTNVGFKLDFWEE